MEDAALPDSPGASCSNLSKKSYNHSNLQTAAAVANSFIYVHHILLHIYLLPLFAHSHFNVLHVNFSAQVSLTTLTQEYNRRISYFQSNGSPTCRYV